MAAQVVDTDGHIFERDEIMLDYVEPPYRGRKEVLLYPFFPPPDGFHRMARRIIDKRPYVVGADDPQTWLEVLDREGIDRTVIYPTAALGVGYIQDPEWAVAACRAYNNMMADRYIKFNRRLGAVAVLPIQDIQESAKELRRAVTELRMAGGVLAPGAVGTGHGLRASRQRALCPQQLSCPRNGRAVLAEGFHRVGWFVIDFEDGAIQVQHLVCFANGRTHPAQLDLAPLGHQPLLCSQKGVDYRGRAMGYRPEVHDQLGGFIPFDEAHQFVLDLGHDQRVEQFGINQVDHTGITKPFELKVFHSCHRK
jgi:hypothetical protein